MLKLLRYLFPKAFFSNASISERFLKPNTESNSNVLLGFIFFFVTQTTLRLMHTISLPACKTHTICHMMFVLALR